MQVLENVLHIEAIRSYIHCNILEIICNNDFFLKARYGNLSELNLVKYMFDMEFENHEWIEIILSRKHDELLYLGDSQVFIDND